MKRLGILGGMGPLATVKLFEKIVNLTQVSKDQEHLPIIIDNNSQIADRTDYILGKSTEDPRRELIISLKRLEKAGADFIIMPCNTAHSFYDDISKETAVPFLHMIEETAKYVVSHYPSIEKIGFLGTDGTIKSGVYDKAFAPYDIKVELPDEEGQKHVYDLIYGIKEGKKDLDLTALYKVMEEMKERDLSHFVAGCTEISVAIDLYQLKGQFIDPMDIIARKSIAYAGGTIIDK